MNRGSIGVIEGEARRVESFQNTNVVDGRDLHDCLEVRQTHEDSVQGDSIQIGRAASQNLTTTEKTRIQEEGITAVEDEIIDTKYAEFIFVPGQFILTTGSGDFVHDLIEESTGEIVDDGNIDIDGLLESKSNADVWKLGFVGRSANADKGVLYGQDINNDSEVSSLFSDSSINQLGIEYESGSKTIKIDVSRSGHVNLYSPSNYDSVEFAQYVATELISHVYSG